MILLYRHGEWIVVVGRGLIGSAIVRELLSDRKIILEEKYPWQKPEEQRALWTSVFAQLNSTLHVVWCAGKAGFSSSEEQTALEFEDYKRAINQLAESGLKIHFHLLSSAGGFYEGQRYVESSSKIHLSRPYSVLKWEQEELIRKAPFVVSIFRLSSVYGYIAQNQRMGLIPTIILRALQQKTVEFVGHFNTLRDYIWVEDVAKYVVSQIRKTPDKKQNIVTLASARPTTILEIKGHVENILSRKVYLTFLKDLNNCADITYSPQIVPVDFKVSDLILNIKKILLSSYDYL